MTFDNKEMGSRNLGHTFLAILECSNQNCRYFEIERWGRHPRQIYSDLTPQSWWREGGGFEGSNDCNALRGMDSSDGQFHALIQRDERLWIFDPQICRRIPLVYEVCSVAQVN